MGSGEAFQRGIRIRCHQGVFQKPVLSFRAVPIGTSEVRQSGGREIRSGRRRPLVTWVGERDMPRAACLFQPHSSRGRLRVAAGRRCACSLPTQARAAPALFLSGPFTSA